MTEHRRARTAARPVHAGHLSRAAVGRRAGEDVVPVRRALPVDRTAHLVKRRVVVDVRLIGVELGDVLRNEDALAVVPGTVANPIAGADRAGTGGAEIGAPHA